MAPLMVPKQTGNFAAVAPNYGFVNSSSQPQGTPATVQSLDSAVPNTSQSVVYQFNPPTVPVLPNSTDPGVAAVFDPLGNQIQVPVVTDQVTVQKTSPMIYVAFAALAALIFFRKDFGL